MPANGTVLAIFIAKEKGAPMERVIDVIAIKGRGLKGDRYAETAGSWSKGREGARQVTLINATFFPGSGFVYEDSRRNIVVDGVELMSFIGKEFQVGGATLKGVKYCDPCDRPSSLIGHELNFEVAFRDRGGLIAEVIKEGAISENCAVIPPPRNF